MTVHATVVGVKIPNKDGSNRQEIIQTCQPGEVLDLVRDPKNPHDKDAIAVIRGRTGEQLGFISKEIAEPLARKMDEKGTQYEAILKKITGGPPGKLSVLFGGKEKPYGCDIDIISKGSA